MKFFTRLMLVIWLGLTILPARGELRFAELGDFELENGQIIQDCRIGYRIPGQMNEYKSNVILYPTWFGGTSEHVAKLVGPGKFLDNSEFCVIIVDPPGNGVSSSPSNSEKQRDGKFPGIPGCEIVILENSCGHLAIGCEMERCSRIVGDFFNAEQEDRL